MPAHYVAQLQVLMEVLDLRAAHFVQYRPEGPFCGQEFVVTEVARDRAWFAAALPVMQSFVAEWRALQGDPEAHEKILGRRRSPAVPKAAPRTAEQLWADVTVRACPFAGSPPDECGDPFGETAAAERAWRLSQQLALAACPFLDSHGEGGDGGGEVAGGGPAEEGVPVGPAPVQDGGVEREQAVLVLLEEPGVGRAAVQVGLEHGGGA